MSGKSQALAETQTKTQDETKKAEIISCPADAQGVSCDGGGGALGHPKVWYAFDHRGRAECGYCDRIFIRDKP